MHQSASALTWRLILGLAAASLPAGLSAAAPPRTDLESVSSYCRQRHGASELSSAARLYRGCVSRVDVLGTAAGSSLSPPHHVMGSAETAPPWPPSTQSDPVRPASAGRWNSRSHCLIHAQVTGCLWKRSRPQSIVMHHRSIR